MAGKISFIKCLMGKNHIIRLHVQYDSKQLCKHIEYIQVLVMISFEW